MEVRGSTPRGPTLWGYSSVGRAPALQAGGQEFESLYLHLLRQIIVRTGLAFFFAEMRDSGRKYDIFVHFRPLSGIVLYLPIKRFLCVSSAFSFLS